MLRMFDSDDLWPSIATVANSLCRSASACFALIRFDLLTAPVFTAIVKSFTNISVRLSTTAVSAVHEVPAAFGSQLVGGMVLSMVSLCVIVSSKLLECEEYIACANIIKTCLVTVERCCSDAFVQQASVLII